MRRFLALSTVALLLAACAGDTEGTHHNGEEDTGTATSGDKHGKPGRPGLHDAGSKDAGPVDETPDAQPMGESDAGTDQERDSGTTSPPKDIFAGTFEVTTTYKNWNNGCTPRPVTTTLVLSKVDAAEYYGLPSKSTRFVVAESWFVVDSSTLANTNIPEVAFTTTGFTGTYTFNGSLGQEPGATGLCSYSGYTLKGVRK